MGSDQDAWLRKLAKEGFEGYSKDDFAIIRTKKHIKIYWRGIWVKSFPSSPSDSRRGLVNAVAQLKAGIKRAEKYISVNK